MGEVANSMMRLLRFALVVSNSEESSNPRNHVLVGHLNLNKR
jgi:hypothetical protein